MRIVIDTNVIVSGLYDSSSVPGRVLDAAVRGSLHLCAPESVREELMRVLTRVLGFTPAQRSAAFEALPVEWIPEAIYRDFLSEAAALLRDASDAPIMACALAIGCDVVSGDGDLHAAKSPKVRVWRPAELAAKTRG